MNLIVDIGNSRAKAVIMASSQVVAEYVAEQPEELWLRDIVSRHDGVQQAIVSSTRGGEERVCSLLEELLGSVVCFRPGITPVPMVNRYHTPETLGADRLAAAVGASAMYSDGDVMVVDFGTAITIDYVIDGAYVGGNISLGVMTRFRSLEHFTAKLPLCSPTEEVLPYGRTTREAIEQGVMQGITHEIEGYISAFMQKNKKKYVIFTGGDAKYFVKRIKNAIFASCEPVIFGLNRILEYNAEIR